MIHECAVTAELLFRVNTFELFFFCLQLSSCKIPCSFHYFGRGRCGDGVRILGLIFSSVASTRTIASVFSMLRGGVRTPEGTGQLP